MIGRIQKVKYIVDMDYSSLARSMIFRQFGVCENDQGRKYK